MHQRGAIGFHAGSYLFLIADAVERHKQLCGKMVERSQPYFPKPGRQIDLMPCVQFWQDQPFSTELAASNNVLISAIQEQVAKN